MASIDIKYSCGCHFSTNKLEAAVKHSDEKCHTLTVLGEVRYGKPRAGLSAVGFVTTAYREPPLASFDTLRAKLGNKQGG